MNFLEQLILIQSVDKFSVLKEIYSRVHKSQLHYTKLILSGLYFKHCFF
jgi:hypothetical protein